MAHPRPLTLLLSAAASAPLAAAVALDGAALSSRGIGAEGVDSVFTSESSADFGPPLTASQSATLWRDATARRWDADLAHSDPDAGGGGVDPTLRPYLLCHSGPGLSGYRRRVAVEGLLRDAGAAPGSVVLGESALLNVADRTCFLASAPPWTFAVAFETLPGEETRYLEVQPLLPSAKMVGGTVDGVRAWLGGAHSAAAEVMGALDHDSAMESLEGGSPLSLLLMPCPAVVDRLDRGEVDVLDIRKDIIAFLSYGGGARVRQSSFFYYAANSYDTVSNRMEFWADAVANATSSTDPVAGYNRCLDVSILQGVGLDFDMWSSSTVSATVRTDPKWNNDCIWYIVYGLALHPYVCRMEPDVIPVEVLEPFGTHTELPQAGEPQVEALPPSDLTPSPRSAGDMSSAERWQSVVLGSVTVALFLTLH